MLGTLFNIGDTITFDVYPSVILGSKYQNVTVLAAVSGELAQAYGFDVVATHANVAPSLPPGSPNNPFAANYLWLQIQYPNKEKDFVAIPWIIADTVQVTNMVDIVVRIRRRTATDSTAVQVALSSAGFKLDSDSIKIEASSVAP